MRTRVRTVLLTSPSNDPSDAMIRIYLLHRFQGEPVKYVVCNNDCKLPYAFVCIVIFVFVTATDPSYSERDVTPS
jgi:hypothetical protein